MTKPNEEVIKNKLNQYRGQAMRHEKRGETKKIITKDRGRSSR